MSVLACSVCGVIASSTCPTCGAGRCASHKGRCSRCKSADRYREEANELREKIAIVQELTLRLSGFRLVEFIAANSHSFATSSSPAPAMQLPYVFSVASPSGDTESGEPGAVFLRTQPGVVAAYHQDRGLRTLVKGRPSHFRDMPATVTLNDDLEPWRLIPPSRAMEQCVNPADLAAALRSILVREIFKEYVGSSTVGYMSGLQNSGPARCHLSMRLAGADLEDALRSAAGVG